MAEGRGVSNYSVDKPSYGFSTSTTEFDDELIRRGIVRFEHAMMAKGASPEEAQRLQRLHQQQQQQQQQQQLDNPTVEKDETSIHSSDIEEEDDDEFLVRYRRQRLQEMKQERQRRQEDDDGCRYGSVVWIQRTDWMREVNEASRRVWVVIVLTSSHDAERTGRTERAVSSLAVRHSRTKFVAIPSRSAIPNWPESNLPTVFCYRHGQLQHQLIQLSIDMTTTQLQHQLIHLGVLSQPPQHHGVNDDNEEELPTEQTNNTPKPTSTSVRASLYQDVEDYDNVD